MTTTRVARARSKAKTKAKGTETEEDRLARIDGLYAAALARKPPKMASIPGTIVRRENVGRIGTLDAAAVEPVREALECIHDVPVRLVEAWQGDDIDELLNVMSDVQCAIEHLRDVYDDRVERFTEALPAPHPERHRILTALAELAEQTAPEAFRDRVSP